ncbi:MAG: patatin-like phospholipase family protein [Gemmatimonadaceae bacterium]|nr:patatin-like phospholipase family protein [Gemmatimonadaceae bacterium]
MTLSVTAERSLGDVLQRRSRIGLVIGSGGIKCTMAIGLLKVLAREGIPVDVAVGCSGGAIYAAMFALGDEVAAIETRSLEVWRDLFTKLHYRSLLRAVAPALFGYHEQVGLVDDRRVWQVLEAHFGTRDFGECRIPLHVAATDFRSGEKVTLTEGRIIDAIRASIAIPLLLRAWPVNDRLLVDGGASNPLPIDIAIREGCDIILAMGFESQMTDDVRSFTNAVGRTSTIVTNHLLRATFAFYSAAHHAEVLPIMPLLDRDIGLTEWEQIPYLIEQGERAAEEQVPYLRRLLAQTLGDASPPRA